MKPLVYRGGNPHPAEVKLAELKDFQTGDQILAAYHFESQLYASWLQPANANRFFIRVMGDDNDSPVKTGVGDKETPEYLLLRGDKIYALIIEDLGKVSSFDAVRLHITDDEVVVHDNLYYSLEPEWPEVSEVTLNSRPATSNLQFWRWCPYGQFMPKYYSDFNFELITGSGMLRVPARRKTLNMCSYWFRPQDITRGYIEFRVIVTPLTNAGEGAVIENIVKINIP